MSDQRYQWAVIIETDDAGLEVCAHIMPIDTHVFFEKKEDAQAMFDRLESYDDPPCVTDDDDQVIGTYFGHTLSKDCVCQPTDTPTVSPVPLYTHRLFQ